MEDNTNEGIEPSTVNSSQRQQPEISRSTALAIQGLRDKLLDIGKRNRLVHTPIQNKRAKQLIIVDELSDEVFKILFQSRKSMAFLAVPDLNESNECEAENENSQSVYVPPEDDDTDESGLASRHVDTNLQTALTLGSLQKCLLTLNRDATAMEDEQGVSIEWHCRRIPSAQQFY